MHMVGHQDIPDERELKLRANITKHFEKEIFCTDRLQVRVAVVTAESKEVQILTSVVALQSFRHKGTGPTLANPARVGHPRSCTLPLTHEDGMLSSSRAVRKIEMEGCATRLSR